MFDGGKKYNMAFRIISAFIIQAFLLMDIAFAAGGDLSWVKQEQVSQSHLAPTVQITTSNIEQSIKILSDLVQVYYTFEEAKRLDKLEVLLKIDTFSEPITIVPGSSGSKASIIARINGQYICMYREVPDFIKEKAASQIRINRMKGLNYSIIDEKTFHEDVLGIKTDQTGTVQEQVAESQKLQAGIDDTVDVKPEQKQGILSVFAGFVTSVGSILSMAMPRSANRIGSAKTSIIMAVAAIGLSVVLIPLILANSSSKLIA